MLIDYSALTKVAAYWLQFDLRLNNYK